MPSVDVTALLVGPSARPKVDALVALLTELWEEELVAQEAVVSVGPVQAENVVAAADRVGEGRVVTWRGSDLAGLIAAVRAGYPQGDVAVWFPTVDLDAFEPSEEDEEEEDDEDEEDGEEDAAPASSASTARDLDPGEFDMVAPTLCVYSLQKPIPLEEKSDYVKTAADAKRLKKFGPCAAWITLDGEDMRYLVEDLVDSWLRDVVEETIGAVKVGKNLW